MLPPVNKTSAKKGNVKNDENCDFTVDRTIETLETEWREKTKERDAVSFQTQLIGAFYEL